MKRLCKLLAFLSIFVACAEQPSGFGTGNQGGEANDVGSNVSSTTSGLGGNDAEKTALDDRNLDYNEALRTASLKTIRSLPTLDQIRRVQNATDKKTAYELEVDLMLDDPRFTPRMIKFWRDVLRQGGSQEMDSAPVFIAKVSIEGKPFTDVFTSTQGTCPSFADGNFVEADCNNNVAVHAGILTNPGSMKQFYSNMAFRRVRWIQEVFMCQKFPAESIDKPTQIDGKDYISPWSFESISNSPINFRDTQSVICANCHTTMNHIAPLFANFDSNGMWMDQSQVNTPILPDPVKTQTDHWLSNGEKTSWRFGIETTNLPALGAAIADDPIVADCVTTRLWNMVMSKEDVVNDLATIPPPVLDPLVKKYEETGMNIKDTLRFMLKHEDFVNF
jgi:hypothetical protein